MNTNNVIQGFLSNWLSKGEEYLKSDQKTSQLLHKAEGIITTLPVPTLMPIINLVKNLFNYIRDAILGRYDSYSKANLLMALAGLVYLISPVDIVPDFIPIAGWLDDIAVLKFVLDRLSSELKQYAEWHKIHSMIV